MKTVLLLLNINDGNRSQVENLEKEIYSSVEEIQSEINNIQICELDDFVSDCNNQDLDIENFWIGHAIINDI